MDTIVVRLVPRGRARGEIDFAAAPSERLAESVRPERRFMDRARRAFAERALAPTATALKRLTVELDPRTLRDMFGDVAMETRDAAGAPGRSCTMVERYQAPDKALPVPDAMRDAVATPAVRNVRVVPAEGAGTGGV